MTATRFVSSLLLLLFVGIGVNADDTGKPATPAASRAPDFVGAVRDAATGKPLAGATVSLAYAHPRQGTSPFCPSCWADCAKRQVTDAKGGFHIAAPDPALLFTVLVVREGYKPTFFNTDPGKGAAALRLTRLSSKPEDPKRLIRGRVVGPDGKPIVGASLEVNGYAQNADSQTFGGMPRGMDPLVITGTDGSFVYHVAPPYNQVLLQVEAPGMARRLSGWLKTGAKQPAVLRMQEGAMITGSLRTPEGKPLPGLAVEWAQDDLNCENCVGPMTIGTDAHGDFVLPNVRPEEASHVCIHSAGALAEADLAFPIVSLKTKPNGAVSALGTLHPIPAATFRGRLRFADGHAIPPYTRLLCSRDSDWDAQQVIVAPDGTFAFHGIPPREPMTLVIDIKGYHLDAKTPGLDSYQPQFGHVAFTAPSAGPMPELTFKLIPDEKKKSGR